MRHGERDLAAVDPGRPLRASGSRSCSRRLKPSKAPARAQILAERREVDSTPPDPIAAWNFENGLVDLKGGLVLSLEGGAKLTPEGLEFDGKTALATSTALDRELSSKTIEVWVRLRNLSQRGGGAMTVQTREGLVFDSIVFGELEESRWMAGSDGFQPVPERFG